MCIRDSLPSSCCATLFDMEEPNRLGVDPPINQYPNGNGSNPATQQSFTPHKIVSALLGFFIPIPAMIAGLFLAPGEAVCFLKCTDQTTGGEALIGILIGLVVSVVILSFALPKKLKNRWAWAFLGMVLGAGTIFLLIVLLVVFLSSL